MSETLSREGIRAVYAADDARNSTPLPAPSGGIAPSALEEMFEGWFRATVAELPGLRVDHYNRFRASADEFKARLRLKET